MIISIIDYGAGNATNVKNALEKIGMANMDALISSRIPDWESADAVIFPGVGSFGAAMKNLGKNATALRAIIELGKTFLGICLGMQLLDRKSVV